MSPAFTQLSPIDTQSLNWIFYYTQHKCYRRYYSSIYSECNGNDQLEILSSSRTRINLRYINSPIHWRNFFAKIFCITRSVSHYVSIFDEIIFDVSSASWKSKFSHSRGNHQALSKKSAVRGKRSEKDLAPKKRTLSLAFL